MDTKRLLTVSVAAVIFFAIVVVVGVKRIDRLENHVRALRLENDKLVRERDWYKDWKTRASFEGWFKAKFNANYWAAKHNETRMMLWHDQMKAWQPFQSDPSKLTNAKQIELYKREQDLDRGDNLTSPMDVTFAVKVQESLEKEIGYDRNTHDWKIQKSTESK